MMQSIPGMTIFNPNRDQSIINIEWPKWKNGMNRYLRTLKISDPKEKVDHMLHCAGLDVQDIFENLPEVENDEMDEYELAIQRLDGHFLRKPNVELEKVIFREITQGIDEPIERFILRLRKQSTHCDFNDPEAQIREQIVAKTRSNKLRQKILEKEKMPLNEIVQLGQNIETIAMKLKESQKRTTVDLPGFESNVNIVKRQRSDFAERDPGAGKGCFRCGQIGHFSRDRICPGRNTTCKRCNFRGHFAKFCRTPDYKIKKPNQHQNSNRRSSFSQNIRSIQDEQSDNIPTTSNQCNSDTGDDYIFHVGGKSAFKIIMGGLPVQVIIDSGADVNLMDVNTWNSLKINRIVVRDMKKGSTRVLKTFGGNKLTIKGEFNSTLTVANVSIDSRWYVVEERGPTLIGRESAENLGILLVGNIHQVQTNVKIGKIKNCLIDLPIDDSVTPVAQPYRRIPIMLEEKVKRKINELLEGDIIEPVNEASRWVSPMVIIPKGDDIRLCIDMRRANKAIIRENHPIPTMDDILPRLRKSKVFSKIDIRNAFHQIEIAPSSRHITTFITNLGLFRYKRLMFGISCAPEIFQKTMDKLLMDCVGCVVYIDDILVFGETREDHDGRLKSVLHRLEDYNVVMNHEKNIFGVIELEFLGHTISGNGIRPTESKVSSLLKFRTPQNVEETRSFLGLINYISRFIPHLSTTAEPLFRLIKHNIKFEWGKEQDNSFQELKRKITETNYLSFFDKKLKTYVITDASPVGLGAMLIQNSLENPNIISFASKTLTEIERRYCQTEKEALAIVWAIERFQIYLIGQKFTLLTDHKPLQFIFSPKSKPCARVERWVLRLMPFDYDVQYIPGKNNIADPLSRLAIDSGSIKEFDEDVENYVLQTYIDSLPVAISRTEMENASSQDEEILQVLQSLDDGQWSKENLCYKVIAEELCRIDSILLRGKRIIVPEMLRKRTLDLAHEGHPGMSAMKRRLRTKVWWPKLDRDVEHYVNLCEGCQLVASYSAPEPMKRRSLPDTPWAQLAVDYIGPLPSGHNLLVVVDYFSRYFEVKIMTKIDAPITIKVLKEIFARFGIPQSVTSDNGPTFRSQEFRDYCRSQNIKLYLSTPYWPQENGEVERQNRTLLKQLIISQNTNRDWKEDLIDFLLMFRTTPHSVLGKSPAELLFGRKIRDKLPEINSMNNSEVYEEERDRDRLHKERGKEYADKRRGAKDSEITVGSDVLMKVNQKSNKLSPNFIPGREFEVVEKSGSSVVVEDKSTKDRYRRNVTHLKALPQESSELPSKRHRKTPAHLQDYVCGEKSDVEKEGEM